MTGKELHDLYVDCLKDSGWHPDLAWVLFARRVELRPAPEPGLPELEIAFV